MCKHTLIRYKKSSKWIIMDSGEWILRVEKYQFRNGFRTHLPPRLLRPRTLMINTLVSVSVLRVALGTCCVRDCVISPLSRQIKLSPVYNLRIVAHSPPRASNTKINSPATKSTCLDHLRILVCYWSVTFVLILAILWNVDCIWKISSMEATTIWLKFQLAGPG